MRDVQKIAHSHRMESWKKIIMECRSSGMSAREFMRERNISEGSYYYWQKLIRQELVEQMPAVTSDIGEPSRVPVQFAPVKVPTTVSSVKSANEPPAMVIHCGKFTTKITEDLPKSLIMKTMSALLAVSK